MGKNLWASIIIFILLSANISFGAFGDVIKIYKLSDYGFYFPISVCFRYGFFWILEAYKEYKNDTPYLLNKEYSLKAGTDELAYMRSYIIYHYRNDINGFDFVTENNSDFIWMTESLEKQLWQYEFLQTGVEEDFIRYRTLKLPQELENEYYPTGITLDNNLNIYFINGLNRCVYRINYSVYSGSTGDINISPEQIIKLFEVSRPPLIPMGIEYESPDYFYITLSGENDYLIKTYTSGNEIIYKDLHDQSNPDYI